MERVGPVDDRLEVIDDENAEDPAKEVPGFLEALDHFGKAFAEGRPAEQMAAQLPGCRRNV